MLKHFYHSLCLFFVFFFLWGCSSHKSAVSLFPQPQSAAIPAVDEEMTIPEPEITVAEEIRELEKLGKWDKPTLQPVIVKKEPRVQYDFPITMNRQVEFYLDFFTKKNKQSFRRWLERSGRYVPMIQEKLQEAGLPLDLAYLPMIESGYSLTAFSRAKAVGPWQFMRATGRHYGLEVNSYVDERRNPVKSTEAAITFLSELYDRFGSWELAVAGYNAGAGKIGKGLKRYKTDNFWDLASKRYLRIETKRYVPKLIAAILIAKNPKKYGFTDIQYHSPLIYETVKVPRWTTLRAVTVACPASLKELQNLNRQLRKLITPPDHASYPLKVPMGMKKTVEENLPKVHATVSTHYKSHVVAGNDTLTRICRRYGINKTTLLKVNDLRSVKLNKGQRIRIPYQVTSYVLLDQKQRPNGVGNGFALHTIKPGETVSNIAKQYNVSPQLIGSWNGLTNLHRIRAGQQLALYLQINDPKIQVIAARTVKKDLRMASAEPTFYEVRKGDTLWAIAKRHHLTSKKIREWNNLKTAIIQPGTQLLLAKPTEVRTLSQLSLKKRPIL